MGDEIDLNAARYNRSLHLGADGWCTVQPLLDPPGSRCPGDPTGGLSDLPQGKCHKDIWPLLSGLVQRVPLCTRRPRSLQLPSTSPAVLPLKLSPCSHEGTPPSPSPGFMSPFLIFLQSTAINCSTPVLCLCVVKT